VLRPGESNAAVSDFQRHTSFFLFVHTDI